MKIDTQKVRPGFTLVELLVVLLIIVILAAVVVPIAATFSKGTAVRDAARTIQAALAGARDRALSNQRPRGVRFIVDKSDPTRVTSLMYVREQDPFTGTCHVVRSETNSAYPTTDDRRLLPRTPAEQDDPMTGFAVNLVVAGPETDFSQFVNIGYGAIRFDSAGPLYMFQYVDSKHLELVNSFPPSSIYRTSQPESALTAPVDFDNDLQITEGVHFTILRQSVPLEEAEPITLPAGVRIDVGLLTATDTTGGVTTRYPTPNRGLSNFQMPNLTIQWPAGNDPIACPYFEVMFSPSGQIIGDQVRQSMPALRIWIREELADVDDNAYMLNSAGDRVQDTNGNDIRIRAVKKTSQPSQHAIVAVHGRTGFVSTAPVNFVEHPAGETDNTEYFDAREYFVNVGRGIDAGL